MVQLCGCVTTLGVEYVSVLCVKLYDCVECVWGVHNCVYTVEWMCGCVVCDYCDVYSV